MTITQGYVAVYPDGDFLRIYERNTHTGNHVKIERVSTLEHATIFGSPTLRMIGNRNCPDDKEFNFVPVEVRREVILKGYGVNK